MALPTPIGATVDTRDPSDAILQYAPDAPPAPGVAIPIAPGVSWVRMAMPTALNHINLWLLADGPAWTAVDTGMATDATRQAWEGLLQHHALSRLIVTHLHPDHVGLSGWLCERAGVPLHMTLGEYASAQLMRREVGPWAFSSLRAFFRLHGAEGALEEALEARAPHYSHGVPSMPDAYRRLCHDDLLTVGDHDWRILVGRGHSPEHASLYCAETRVLISGDMMLPRISTNIGAHATTPEDDPLALFLDSIAALRALPEDTLVLPSHGKPFRGLHARIDQLEHHHAGRCQVLLDACDTPRTASELLPVLFERPLSDGHQIFFALAEAIAHLNHLVVTGRLQRMQRDGIVRFQRL